jgi:hypothetical protein
MMSEDCGNVFECFCEKCVATNLMDDFQKEPKVWVVMSENQENTPKEVTLEDVERQNEPNYTKSYYNDNDDDDSFGEFLPIVFTILIIVAFFSLILINYEFNKK